jgi:hypothetical protein
MFAYSSFIDAEIACLSRKWLYGTHISLHLLHSNEIFRYMKMKNHLKICDIDLLCRYHVIYSPCLRSVLYTWYFSRHILGCDYTAWFLLFLFSKFNVNLVRSRTFKCSVSNLSATLNGVWELTLPVSSGDWLSSYGPIFFIWRLIYQHSTQISCVWSQPLPLLL